MKNKIRKFVEKYDMEILRNPITREAWGMSLDANENILELDKLKEEIDRRDRPPMPTEVEMTTEYLEDIVRYKIICPTTWFDLYGWR